jgi:hypothetical protein
MLTPVNLLVVSFCCVMSCCTANSPGPYCFSSSSQLVVNILLVVVVAVVAVVAVAVAVAVVVVVVVIVIATAVVYLAVLSCCCFILLLTVVLSTCCYFKSPCCCFNNMCAVGGKCQELLFSPYSILLAQITYLTTLLLLCEFAAVRIYVFGNNLLHTILLQILMSVQAYKIYLSVVDTMHVQFVEQLVILHRRNQRYFCTNYKLPTSPITLY